MGLSLLGTVLLVGAASASAAIPEMIVTVRKREESVLEVPVAVSAFSASDIEQLGLTDITDIARFTPGFALNPGLGRQPASYRPVFRGVTTVRNGVANASAGNTFVDGVYVGSALLSTELENVERVEIMRGPQSAQYGRNTYAGAINYVTRKPSAQNEGRVTATAAQHDSYDVSGWVSGPLGAGQVRYALAAGHHEYGGEWNNLRDGSDIGGEESNELTAKLLFEPSDDLDITLKAGWQRTDDDHFAMYLQPSTLNNCCERTADAPRAREYYVGKAVLQEQVNLFTDLLEANGGAGTELDRLLASLAANWRIGDLTITSLTGFIDDEYELGFDESFAAYDPGVPPGWQCGSPLPPGSPPPGSFLNRQDKQYDDFSQELRLTSSPDRALRFTAGAYFYEGETELTAAARIDPCTGIAAAIDRDRDEVENRAVFGGVAWDFAEDWNLGVELRWAKDNVTVTRLPVVQPARSYDADEENLTPRFTLSWAPLESTTYYANVSKGTKPPDFNTQVPDESYREVAEESLWNYELGVKGLYLEQRLSVALAGYYIDITDQQLTQLIELPSGGTASLLTNAGRTEVWGLEAELVARPVENVTLQATYAYTDSEFREWISQEQADLRGSDGSFEDNQLLGNVAGQQSPRVPEHMASLIVRYERPVNAAIDWYGSADYSYESSNFAAEHNLIETGDRNLVGLRTGLAFDRWDVSMWAKNLLDDDTPVDVMRFFDRRTESLPSFPQLGPRPSSTPRAFGIPLPRGRQVGATVRYRF
ncbi:MAG: TonB-dependent receptor [Gammaproteobacteria bacterium]|nr:MAG: TonB-dependent receptor [Gammaproteobacteria bacterium]